MVHFGRLGKFFLFATSLVASYLICYFLAEHAFFDKFFYRKSVNYGYMVSRHPDLSEYGDRAKDLIWLISAMKNEKYELPESKGSYNIAIIGDSYVWGQGIKNQDRFAPILQKELNNVRKTKVYSFGMGGDNLLEDYEKIKFLESTKSPVKIDLFILTIVHDDMIVNDENPYVMNYSKNIIQDCKKLGAFNTQGGFLTPSNLCTADKVLADLPQNLIVFEPEYFIDNQIDIHNRYVSLFSKYGRTLINPIKFMGNLSSDKNVISKMQVSKMEGHPSVLANKIFVKTLFSAVNSYPSFARH